MKVGQGHYRSIWVEDGAVRIIDQTRLPHEFTVVTLATLEDAALEMAVAGLGCAITLASLAEVHLRRGLLVAPFPDKIPSGWGYDLHSGEVSPTRASEKLRAFLLAEAPGQG